MTRNRAHSGFIIMIESRLPEIQWWRNQAPALASNNQTCSNTSLPPGKANDEYGDGDDDDYSGGFLTVWSSSWLLSATIRICVTIGGTNSAININPILSDHLMIICKQRCDRFSQSEHDQWPSNIVFIASLEALYLVRFSNWVQSSVGRITNTTKNTTSNTTDTNTHTAIKTMTLT